MTGLLLPASSLPKTSDVQVRLFLVYRDCDVSNFQRRLAEAGGVLSAVVRVPRRNDLGQIVGDDYAILYEHTEEFFMETLT